MRAVNLIPADERRGAGGAAGRSGGGVYLLLGALALTLAMTTMWVLAGRSVTGKQAQLASVTHQADQAEAQASGLQAYTRFAAIRAKRVQTVTQLASSRFDWAHALHEVARVLPANAWLTQLIGTTSPDVTVGGGTGASSLRGDIAAPAIEISGCTTSQASVAKMLARMRLIDGVQRVSLADSSKSGTGGGSGGGNGDCRGNSKHFPMFDMVVFFEQPAAAPPAAAGTTPTAATAPATPAPGTSTTPAATATTPAAPTSTTPSATATTPASGGTTP